MHKLRPVPSSNRLATPPGGPPRGGPQRPGTGRSPSGNRPEDRPLRRPGPAPEASAEGDAPRAARHSEGSLGASGTAARWSRFAEISGSVTRSSGVDAPAVAWDYFLAGPGRHEETVPISAARRPTSGPEGHPGPSFIPNFLRNLEGTCDSPKNRGTHRLCPGRSDAEGVDTQWLSKTTSWKPKEQTT